VTGGDIITGSLPHTAHWSSKAAGIPQARFTRGATSCQGTCCPSPEGHEHAALFLRRGSCAGRCRSPHRRIVYNHGTAKGLVSQLDTPDDVPPRSQSTGDCPLAPPPLGLGPMGVAGTRGETTALQTRCQRFDSTPTQLRDQCGIAGAPVSAPRAICAFGPMPSALAAQCAHRGIHPSELINCVQRLRGRADVASFTSPSGRRNRIARGSGQFLCRRARLRPMRKASAVQRTCGSSCERALTKADTEGPARLPKAPKARGHRARPANPRLQCPSQRRLYPFRIGCQVDQGIDGASPNGVPILPKHVRQHPE
jgi:hypothetical protein